MRKMATVRKIQDILPIENADSIECAVVGGWKIVAKKGEFSVGDMAVYLEIDSWVPHELAPFLSKGKEPREYNGVKGERLRTVKLRKQISQGLLLPLSVLPDDSIYEENDDVSSLLNIQKWEAPIPVQLQGEVQGSFPSEIPKTDQERIQNLEEELEEWKADDDIGFWEMTEKLDGSSMTCYLDLDGEFHVCSRNLDLKRNENNTFWKVAIENEIEEKMRAVPLYGYALQGELIGEGIQKNRYNVNGHEYHIFDIYGVKEGKYLDSKTRTSVVKDLGLNQVPYLCDIQFSESTIDFILDMAEDKSKLNPKAEREGIVFKNHNDPSLSFKAISNKFLLKGGD